MLDLLTPNEVSRFPRIADSIREDLESLEPIAKDYRPMSIDIVFDGGEENNISIVNGQIYACDLLPDNAVPQSVEIFFEANLVLLVIGPRVIVNRLGEFDIGDRQPIGRSLTQLNSSWIEN